MCQWVTAAVLTRPVSPRGVLDDVVHPDAGGGLRRLVRRPHDRSVVADVRHGEPMRPGELTDGRHQRIGGRPADTDVDQVFANGVVGDRQPRTATIKNRHSTTLQEPRISQRTLYQINNDKTIISFERQAAHR